MKSQVTMKETVGTKIIYAALLAVYYWMWAREDWHAYYDTIQNVMVVFTIVYFAMRVPRIRKYQKAEKDVQAIQTLRRIDAAALKALVAADIAAAFACAVTYIDGKTAGYVLVGAILVLSIVRFVLFCVMDVPKQ